MWHVYVLLCADDSLYVGMSNDVQRRLREHRRGLVMWTGPRLPVRLIHQEEFASRSAARRREKHLKSGSGKEWLRKTVRPGLQQQ